MERRVRGNSHARCGAGEKPEEIECGLRPHSNTKGLPIAIVPGGGIGGLERLAVPPEPQRPLYRHHPGQGAADHRGPGGDCGGDDGKRQEKPPLFWTEAAAPGKGGISHAAPASVSAQMRSLRLFAGTG